MLRLAVLLAFLAWPVMADTLRYGDIGFYAGIGSIHNPYIVQGDLVIAPVGWSQNPEMVNARIALAREHGMALILDVQFRRLSEPAIPANAALFADRIAALLDQIDLTGVYAVSIGEENGFDRASLAMLDAMYRRLKARFPTVAFYQWFSPTKYQRWWPGKWAAAPGADGWIEDQYFLAPDAYRAVLTGYEATGKPVISLVWLSPDWRPGGARQDNRGWWHTPGWKRFYERVHLAQRYDNPLAVFMYRRPVGIESLLKFYGDVTLGIYPPAIEFIDAVTETTFGHIRAHAPMPWPRPLSRPSWIPPWRPTP